MLLTTNPDPLTFSEEDKAAVHQQLRRLLVSPFFSHSRRFPAMLRFVVENTLEGRADLLKERTLGIEIFGKAARYDTANDPIVRVTAAEIRKRLALYYGEPGHESEVRLSLPAGSYIPHFEWPRPIEQPPPLPPFASHVDPVSPAQTIAHPPEIPTHIVEPTYSRPRRHRFLLGLLGLATAVLILGGLYAWKTATYSPVRAFWAPILGSSDPVLFCVADQTEYTAIELRDAAQPSHQIVLRDNLTAVVIDDVVPIVDMAGILRQNGKRYSVLGEGATTLNDLRNGPAVFIGAYDNAWTLRLVQPLRFHFANNPEMTRFWIADASSTKPSPWAVDRHEQIETNIYRDYAIVSRFTDSDTGRLSVIAAGIGRGGTIAAGEFLTNPGLLSQLDSLIHSSGTKNFEAVLSTQIIGGQPGTPRIEASYTW